METLKDIKSHIAGSDLSVEEYKGMVKLVGQEKADSIVKSQLPRPPQSPTVGFLNPFNVDIEVDLSDGSKEKRRITKQRFKLALRQEQVAGSPLESQCIDGWLHLTGVFTPNANNNGYFIKESFIGTIQEANAREADKPDNTRPFVIGAWMSRQDAPQDSSQNPSDVL